jgi:hypothetical protein
MSAALHWLDTSAGSTLEIVQYKCWYYDTACEAGTEDAPRNMLINEMPEEA